MKLIDKKTQHYRVEQFKKIATVYSEYKPKIKIIKSNGSTNWLDIKEGELVEIMRLLTQSSVRIDHDGEYHFPTDVFLKTS